MDSSYHHYKGEPAVQSLVDLRHHSDRKVCRCSGRHLSPKLQATKASLRKEFRELLEYLLVFQHHCHRHLKTHLHRGFRVVFGAAALALGQLQALHVERRASLPFLLQAFLQLAFASSPASSTFLPYTVLARPLVETLQLRALWQGHLPVALTPPYQM